MGENYNEIKRRFRNPLGFLVYNISHIFPFAKVDKFKKNIGKFTKKGVVELCPGISEKTIERVLKTLVEENFISKNGQGKNTFYLKQ